MNIPVCAFFVNVAFNLLTFYLGVELLGHRYTLAFSWYRHAVFHSGYINLHSYLQCMRV